MRCFRGICAAALFAVLALAAGCGEAEQETQASQPATTPILTSPQQGAELPARRPEPAKAAAQGGKKFDFYVLALNWSPSYCEAEGAGANEQQCGGRPYAFVVHGLWPQFERGFPTDCKTDIDRVSSELVDSLYDIMPSAALIGHQWRRHGSCSGFRQEDYFATLRQAREKIVIPAAYGRLDMAKTVGPEAVERAFVLSNPSMPAAGISTVCDKRYFREVRICLTKELAFRPCPELEQRGCRAAKVVMPPVRGR
jgi:ribonuclease T2